MNSRREISSRFTNDIHVCLATQMAWCWFQPIGKRYLEDWHLINSEQSLCSRSESEREKWIKQWRPSRGSFPFSLARPRANSPFPFPFNACHVGYIWPCSRYIFNSLCQITLSNHVSTRQTNFYSLLLFISFDTWTSTLHFTEIRTFAFDTHLVHFASHRVIFQTQPLIFSTQLLNFCLRFSDHWSRQNKPSWGWEMATDRPPPPALSSIMLCEKRESVGNTRPLPLAKMACLLV